MYPPLTCASCCPLADVLKYFGCELGAQTKYDKVTNTCIVNGEFAMSVQQLCYTPLAQHTPAAVGMSVNMQQPRCRQTSPDIWQWGLQVRMRSGS